MRDLVAAVPLWGVFLMTLLIVLAAADLGYRVGARRRRAAHEADAPIGTMVGATLGLLAFLLAFTFGFAADLYQKKREVLLEEANAIGTTYLRGEMLSEAHGPAVRTLLREYVDVRLAGAAGEVAAAIRRSEELHTELWQHAVASMREDPHSIATGLFVQALNEVIDIHAKRLAVAVRTRVPSTIWVALLAVAFFAFGTMGYQNGLGAGKRSMAVLAVSIAFTSVIWLIADMDRSQEGTLRISQQVMIDLRNSMTAP